MVAEPPRRLLVLRHAEARPLGRDHDRPLSDAGQRSLPGIARRLADQPVDVVLCSSARRAVETLTGVRAALPPTVRVHVEDTFYLAGSETWLERCRALDASVTTTLLIGHNPGLEALINSLAPAVPTPTELELGVSGSRRSLSPGSLAALEVAAAWPGLDPDGARLTTLHHPLRSP